jgi:hypothetical protein
MSQAPNAKPKRRWFRFSVRTLLILVAIVSVGFGWLGHKMRQGERQREIVEMIKKLRGSVTYDYEFDSEGFEAAHPKPPAPAWLAKLLGIDFFASVVAVNVDGSSFRDSDWMHILGLTELERLSLGGTQITDAGLMHLYRFTKLKLLNLHDTQITDAGLVHLRALPVLQRLTLNRTKVTDAGLVHLRDLTHLQVLFLGSTSTTDAGLIHLHGLTRLIYVNLSAAVTDKGRAELQDKLPAKVYFLDF